MSLSSPKHENAQLTHSTAPDLPLVGPKTGSQPRLPGVRRRPDQPRERAVCLQAIDNAPHEIHLYNRLGVALRQQQKHHQALECYQQALKLDPQNEKIYYNFGVLYLDWGEKDKALEAIQVALQLRPDFAEAQDFLQRHFST